MLSNRLSKLVTAKLASLLMLLLSGCATLPQQGNYLNQSTTGFTEVIVDTAKQIESVYLPAKTKLVIQQPIDKSDAFGTVLINQLRQDGYAVQEYVPSAPGKAKPQTDGIGFTYLVDAINGYCRVQINIGGYQLTRPFQTQNGQYTPVGVWVKRGI